MSIDLGAKGLVGLLRNLDVHIDCALHYGGFERRMLGCAIAGGNLYMPPFIRYAAPYCLMPLEARDDEDRAILLNRDYKPVGIGIPYNLFVDYEAFPAWHLTEDALRRARDCRCWRAVGHSKALFLFNDETPPWKSARQLRRYWESLLLLRGALEGA